MPSSSPTQSRRLLALAGVTVALAALAVWFFWNQIRPPELPQPGSSAYEEYVDDFEVGTAALDSGSLNERAIEKLSEAIKTIPQEPAAWVNRGIAYLRTNKLEEAAADLEQARKLAPDNPNIEESLSYVAENQGKLPEAVEHIRRGIKAEPNNVLWLYRLSELLAKNSDDANNEQKELLETILQLRPSSLFILSERTGLAIRRNDMKTLRDSLNRFEKLSAGWQLNTREALDKLRKDAAKDELPKDVVNRLSPFQNLVKQEVGYARDAELISPRSSAVGTTFQTFLRLQPVKTMPSPPDLELKFLDAKLELHKSLEPSKVRGDQVLFPVWLNAREKPVVVVASATAVQEVGGSGLKLPFPSGANQVPPSMAGGLAVDLNNDERMDLVLAGAGGVKFYLQAGSKSFENATEQTKLPSNLLNDDYYGAWAADVDMDGDLDIILARRKGDPVLLRNNFDGTFTAMSIFPGVEGARAFAWIDIDNDGAPDAVFLDAKGKLHVFMNKRSGVFHRRTAPDPNARYAALTVADVNDDGVLDLIAVRQDGVVFRLSDKEKGNAWETAEVVKLEKKLPLIPGEVRLVRVDLDNNGALDLVLRTNQGGQAWFADGNGSFQTLAVDVPIGTADIVSLDDRGQFDLLTWSVEPGTGHALPARRSTQGTRDYHWINVRTRFNPVATGDNRVNSLGLGSDVEIRSGTLVVKQPVDRPVVHFGLGTRNKVAVIRVVWTNGSAQYEFDKKSDVLVVVEQRLKGSCPFLYTWDGTKMVFVTDFCWSTPLGMYINAQTKGGFAQTTDWVKIAGKQLVPRDGYYDIRVNANLWETHFLDHLSLMVVDHPPDTELHVDERFFLTPTAPQYYLTGPSQPVARAWDHKGKDVTDIVRAIDGNYLDRAGRGIYQGVTADHWVEVDLGDDAPKEGPVYLLAHGWIHPTDSSINAAMEQGTHPKPTPLMLEAPDGKGGWKVAQVLGFPAGKNKTCVIRLDGIDGKAVTRRFRLRTNLEIFWDALHYARGLDASGCVRKSLLPTKADLQFRGHLRMTQASPSAPELPHYDEVVCAGQYWRDLIGFHTRFGDVRELLAKIDDRYVIMNAGDELRMRFEPPAPPKAGWKRDFVWICDGWVKDGDMNTRFGKTVLPLPSHGMTAYETPPGRLEEDPVYRRFPKDWETYHTRYITPIVFERGLRNFSRPSR